MKARESEVCASLVYRDSAALSNMYPGAHISCTVNRTMWDLSLPMPPLAFQ